MRLTLSMSGLESAARAIDVIGNNIANSQTIGFKSSKVRFADVFAAMPAGSRATGAEAAGVSATTIRHQFTQGSFEYSGNPLDMAIAGQGFFRLDNDGEISYTRDGQFQLAYDPATPDRRFLVNRTGLAVTGYIASYGTDPQGTIEASGSPQGIYIDPVMPASATTAVTVGATLDSRAGVPTVAPFAANNPLTYTNTTAITVYDAEGASHELRMYFLRSAPGSLWDLYTTLDGVSPTGPVSLSFDTNGQIATAMPLASQTYPVAAGGSLAVALDFSGTVQYGRTFSLDSIVQDGYPEGAIQSAGGFSTDTDGVISANYSNGQSRRVAQIVLATFANAEALINIGDGQWVENADPDMGSGAVYLDTPGRLSGDKAMGLGTLQGGAKELSNVDLSVELVALIEQQRNYQSSAQTFKIMDQALQNLASIR